MGIGGGYSGPAMAAFTPLSTHDAETLLSAYALGELRRLSVVTAGSVNSNFRLEVGRAGSERAVFLRVFEEQGDEGARYDAALLAHLAARGVPSPQPLRRRDGEAVSHVAGKPAVLFPYVDGVHSCQRAVGFGRVEALGRALGQLHRAGLTFPQRRAGRFGLAQIRERLPRIAASPDPALSAMAPQLATALDRWTAARADAVPEGVVHGDLFRDNVLWKTADGPGHHDVTALLDFESASDGRLIYDLAVTVLAWCHGESFDVGLARALVAGYETVRRLEEAERAAMRAELAIAALRFTVTRITDYAMPRGGGERVIKDWRRFWARLAAVEAMPPWW